MMTVMVTKIMTIIMIMILFRRGMDQEEAVNDDVEGQRGKGVAGVVVAPHADLDRHDDRRVEEEQPARQQHHCRARSASLTRRAAAARWQRATRSPSGVARRLPIGTRQARRRAAGRKHGAWDLWSGFDHCALAVWARLALHEARLRVNEPADTARGRLSVLKRHA